MILERTYLAMHIFVIRSADAGDVGFCFPGGLRESARLAKRSLRNFFC